MAIAVLQLSLMPTYSEGFVRLLTGIILAQFAVIAVLLGGLSNEYLSNAYYQVWVAKNMPLLGFLLHGEIDALFIGVAIGGTILLVQRRVDGAKTESSTVADRVKPLPPTYPTFPPVQTPTVQDQPVPNHTPFSQKKNPRQERPEDISAELEKQDQ